MKPEGRTPPPRLRRGRGPAAPGACVLASLVALPCILLLAGLAGATDRANPPPADSSRAPAPASRLTVEDVPNDAGRALTLAWRASPDDLPGGTLVARYLIDRAPEPGGPWSRVDSVAAGETTGVDATVQRNFTYFYRVTAAGPGGETPAGSVTGPVRATSQWLEPGRTGVFISLVVFLALVLYFTQAARAGAKLAVRRVPGLESIEAAIAAAAATRRGLLFVPGTFDIDDLQTLAGLAVLRRVAGLCALHEVPLQVPVAFPLPLVLAEDAIRSGCRDAGRADRYEPGSARFVSPDPFAYAAAVGGMMLRDRPAALVCMGGFSAESLLLAEAAAATGAIHVAGTGSAAQLPYFVASCDHTLVGEELFAAAACLSGEPRLVGSLRGADAMKLLTILVILAGCLLESFGMHGLTTWLSAGAGGG